ncbi:MAG TPA: PEP-utilizing enzyme, partial [Gammaproteobacteria bacterium]
WRGIGVSPGTAEGRARVLAHPGEGARLGQGEILIAATTDTGWTPLFLRASGIVTEQGGYLSHGAIVARELGIPAVVNLPNALTALGDEPWLRLDGNSGTVSVQSASSPLGG